jgi:DNA-binding CsgD family transcriptional regulator
MGVASKTVANSVGILKQKLGVERTAELIRLALSLKNEG